MKIVINRCYGEFGLSISVLKRYVELKGMTPYFYGEDYKTENYYKMNNINEKRLYNIVCITKDLGDRITSSNFWKFVENNKDKYIYHKDIPKR